MKKISAIIISVLCLTVIFSQLTLIENKKSHYIELELIRERIEQMNNDYEYITFSDLGAGSWYDYTLDNGWSSVGHYVCASRDFNRYSMLKVVNLDNGKSTGCLVTDYVENPDVIIDLSSTAFKELAPLEQGIIDNLSIIKIN